MPSRGRTSKLTLQLQNAIAIAVAEGVPLDQAAHLTGIAEAAVREWLQRGTGTHPTRPCTPAFAEFAESITRARAQDEARRIQRINEAGQGGIVVAVHRWIPVELAKWDPTLHGPPWRLIKGVKPDALKGASPVLNGGDEETSLSRPRLVATQLECGLYNKGAEEVVRRLSQLSCMPLVPAIQECGAFLGSAQLIPLWGQGLRSV
jgi:hypothetical protein